MSPRRRLSHLDSRGRVRMVDVSAKTPTAREALARGRVFLHDDTLSMIASGRTPKGDVLATAHLAAVFAAKRTSEWIPLAHPVPVEAVDVSFAFDEAGPSVGIEVRVRTTGRTGVEMEALTAVAAAALTLYDMLKAVDRGMVIGEIALWEKRGGRSGTWLRSRAGSGARRAAKADARTPRAAAARSPGPRAKSRGTVPAAPARRSRKRS